LKIALKYNKETKESAIRKTKELVLLVYVNMLIYRDAKSIEIYCIAALTSKGVSDEQES
jgi:hypothetical protein